MDKFSRKTRILELWKKQKFLPEQWLADKFEKCVKTIRRDMDQLEADGYPIVKDINRGYWLDNRQYIEVQGLWFSPEELHALLLIQQLTEKLAGGSFDMKPLNDKIEKLLHKMSSKTKDMSRFRVFHVGSRAKNMPNFGVVTQTLLSRKQLNIVYHGREKDKISKRTISPQRMIFYKGNWYVDAWCHEANALRSFAVERIIEAEEVEQASSNIAEDILDKHFTQTFGIYSGTPTHTAILHFSEKAALWVEDEEWFPDTTGTFLENGKYKLCIPYNNPTELIMEICRYGADVEVIEPPELRVTVKETLQQAAKLYS